MPSVRLREDALRKRHHAADVVPRRELRHHAAVDRVHRDLRVQRVREQATGRVVHGEAGFIAGGFNADDDHEVRSRAGPVTIHGRLARRSCGEVGYRVILVDCQTPAGRKW